MQDSLDQTCVTAPSAQPAIHYSLFLLCKIGHLRFTVHISSHCIPGSITINMAYLARHEPYAICFLVSIFSQKKTPKTRRDPCCCNCRVDNTFRKVNFRLAFVVVTSLRRWTKFFIPTSLVWMQRMGCYKSEDTHDVYVRVWISILFRRGRRRAMIDVIERRCS